MTDASAAHPDGRRRRAQDSRARIVAAMLEIVHAGEVSPSAEQVAARADVGLRTVFRHFRDMDSLYREMTVAIEAELMTVVATPFVSTDWRGRVLELIERRSSVFEKVGPYMRASMLARDRSKLLEANGVRLAAMARAILKAQLPAELARDQLVVEALDLLLSFETWSRLRRTQGLSPKRARETLEAAIGRLID